MKNIVVCIKQVPDTNDIKWTKENNIQRDGILSIINPCDVFGIDCALKIKKENPDIKITVVTMGPNQAKNALYEALALGCDEAVLLSGKSFVGSDTLATGKTLASCIRKNISDFDLIICGQYALDGDTAQTGPTLSNFLGIEHISRVSDIKVEREELIITQEDDEGFNICKATYPLLLCVSGENTEKNYPKIDDYILAQQKEIREIGLKDLDISKEETGILGSPTWVSGVFRKQVKRIPRIIEEFSAENLIKEINEMRKDVK